MNDSQKHKAAELLRELTGADCINNNLRLALTEGEDGKNGIKREGGVLADFGEERGSYEKRALLPTAENLKSALGETLPSCGCNFCSPLASQSEHANNEVTYSKHKDWATLILCGCIFIARYSKFNQSESLEEFVNSCRGLSTKGHLEIFRSTTPTSECKQQHGMAPVKWNDIRNLNGFCNECRWRAFEDAFLLKRTIMMVAKYPWEMTTFEQEDISDTRNMPFIKLGTLDEDPKNAHVRFYTGQIHPFYIQGTDEPGGKNIFRKVYAFQHRKIQEQDRIKEAKKEIVIAHKMSQTSKSCAKLLYAFSNKGHDYQVVELVFEKYEGSLDTLLLRDQRYDPLAKSAKSLELVDSMLWKETVKVVEAVVAVYSCFKSLNPLDIKLANILWRHNKDKGIALYLTDFGHISEINCRRATIDYAPPLGGDPSADEDHGIGHETARTYDVWSMACVLIQMLIFIKDDHPRTRVKTFDLHRRQGYDDAAFWCEGTDRARLRPPVVRHLDTLRNQERDRTLLVIEKIRQMFNIEPVQRDTMESCLGTLIKTADDRRPKDKDVMMCSCEKWSVFYQNQKSENFTAHLAVYRDSYQDILIVNPNQQRQEGIHIDLDVEGRKDLLGHATYPRVRFSPAGFFELENTNEEKALRFDSLHSDYTLYFAKVDQYHRFITLMTRQEIVGNIKDPPGVGRDFLVGSCKINKGKTLYEDGTLQLWKLLPEDNYDKEFARTCPASSSGGVSTITWSRHPSETRLTPFKLILWTRSQSYHRKACLIVDIGEDTWELEVDKKDTSCLKVGRKHIYTNAFRNQQLRAAIFYEEQDPSGRTDERYPYVPIDPVELQKTLQQGVVKDMDIHFKSPKGKSHHNAKAS